MYQNIEPNEINWKGLNVCVLLPDYSTTEVDYQHYDPARNLSALIPEANITHVFLNKLSTYKQLKELKKKNYQIYVNLCEGYLEWEVPSIDVINSLDLLNLPYTGPNALLYDPPKELMKYVAYTEGVKTPLYILIDSLDTIEKDCEELRFPLFVKPEKAGDSLGIDERSLVYNLAELKAKAQSIFDEYAPLLVEEFIDGREFTVMLAANASDNKTITCFHPVEYIFQNNNQFKTYALKTSDLHPSANIPVNEEWIVEQLKTAAINIFNAFNAVGYARLDFRMDANGDLFFLEINFTCSVFYSDGYEGSADYILKHDGFGQSNFLKKIIQEGIYRHQNKQKKYFIKGSPIAGYGIYARQDIATDELIFRGEERAQRLVTLQHVLNNWNIKEKEIFRKFAYPVSKEVFLLWDQNPSEWAPQNHSCSPNTVYKGLNVIANKNIKKGEEFTLDYASFLDENMEPFQCKCGAANCRGYVSGNSNNSIT